MLEAGVRGRQCSAPCHATRRVRHFVLAEIGDLVAAEVDVGRAAVQAEHLAQKLAHERHRAVRRRPQALAVDDALAHAVKGGVLEQPLEVAEPPRDNYLVKK